MATMISERKNLHSFSPELKRNDVLPTIARGIQAAMSQMGAIPTKKPYHNHDGEKKVGISSRLLKIAVTYP